MSHLSLQDVEKAYGGSGGPAVRNVRLEVKTGEFVTFLGPSGSGKTTTLSMVAGFINPTNGKIEVDGRDITNIPPHQRNIGMVFQDYSLFPHMTVEENVAFPLRMRGISKKEMARMTGESLEAVGLGGFGGRLPIQLSGGQQQRVAIARAIVYRPAILLMDEPLGALDRLLRERLQLEIKQIQQEMGITTLYVTHDQGEALTMSDRICVFNEGEIVQVGTPTEIYERPNNTFVAGFVGESNFIDGSISAKRHHDSHYSYEISFQDAGSATIESQRDLPLEGQVSAVIRPEQIRVQPTNGEARPTEVFVRANVRNVIYRGESSGLIASLSNGATITVRLPRNEPPPSTHQEIKLTWAMKDMVLLPRGASQGKTQ